MHAPGQNFYFNFSVSLKNFLDEKNHILQAKLNAKIIDAMDLYRGEISLELQKITQNKLQNILTSSRYKILGLVGEINV